MYILYLYFIHSEITVLNKLEKNIYLSNEEVKKYKYDI